MKPLYIPRRLLVLSGTFVLSLLLYIDRICISAAKEEISADFNFSLTDFGWIMAAFTLGYALFQTPSGRMADKYGARNMITGIVTAWSALTALTGAAWNFVSMLIIRFLFGAGEAGAFPSMAKVSFYWFPINERGIVQGVNFSGSRLGAAFALPLVAWLIGRFGWRTSFIIFGTIGLVYASLWFIFFRRSPDDVSNISQKEKDHIIKNRQGSAKLSKEQLKLKKLLGSRNIWFAMIQYIASNFTFYFTLAWMYPYIKEKFSLGGIEAGFISMIPLLAGAAGNLVSGFMVDAIYKKGYWKLSRLAPATIGFLLAAGGMLLLAFYNKSVNHSILFLSLAIFGADMTLSPSWAFCVDIGKEYAATVSGTMNMAGNLGAFITIIAFPYLLKWTGRHEPFFYVCCGLSVLAIIMWMLMKPQKSIVNR